MHMFRDLIGSADTIVSIAENCASILENVKAIQASSYWGRESQCIVVNGLQLNMQWKGCRPDHLPNPSCMCVLRLSLAARVLELGAQLHHSRQPAQRAS